jgi:glycosyltransferase involved in cell wall biosynthesis
MPFDLSVVIPCYNEEGNLPELIRQLDGIVAGKPIEVVLVNNGSLDRSAAVFDQELSNATHRDQFRLITIRKNVGYGHGILTGLKSATGRVLSYTHADLQCDPRSVLTAYELYLETEKRPEHAGGEFLVKGQRHDRREDEKLFSYNLDRLASFIMRGPMIDINGQPKMFARSFFEKFLGDAPVDLTLDVYVMARALRQGWAVKTVPVYFGVRKAGVSSWNTTLPSRLRMMARFIRTVFKARLQTLHKV